MWYIVFLCAGCNASYVGETTRPFSTRVREHLVSDGTSHIFRHLQNSQQCRTLCSHDCFSILDHTSTSFYTYSIGATYIKSHRRRGRGQGGTALPHSPLAKFWCRKYRSRRIKIGKIFNLVIFSQMVLPASR